MMNDIMPFTSDTNVPPPLAPQPVWPSYSAVPQQYPYYNQAPAFRAPKAATPAAPQATTQAAPAKKAEKTAKVGDAASKVPAKTAPASKNAEVIMPGTSPVTLKEVSN